MKQQEPTNNNPGKCEKCAADAVIVLGAMVTRKGYEREKLRYRDPIPGSKAHPRCANHLPSKPFTE